MIRVLDEARSVDFYEQAFGLTVQERIVFPDFALIYLAAESGGFELN